MAQRNIDFGAFPDDPDADAIRSAFEKVQLNFTEVFAGLGDQAVVSVNKTAGAGVTVNQSTGNVVVTANLACVQMTTTTLQLGQSGPGNGVAGGTIILNASTQQATIDLPTNIVTGLVNLTATGNVTGGNVNATSGGGNFQWVKGDGANLTNIVALVAQTVSNAAQPNITSVGTLSGLAVTGNITSGNVAGTGGVFTYFSGDGANLSFIAGGNVTGTVPFATTANAVAGANVSGEVDFAQVANAVAGANVSGTVPLATSATTAGTVTTAAQPNITSTGTLTVLNSSGTITAPAFTANTGIFTGDGAGLTNVTGANVSGAVPFAGTANAVAGANVSGEVDFAQVANAVAGANVSGEVTFAATANAVAGANVTGTVSLASLATFATTANAVAGANVSGTVPVATSATSANAVAGANVSGTVPLATTAGTVTTAAQPNITSVGTLTALTVTADIVGSVTGSAATITTAAQPNITSVGTLSTLAVTGNIASGNVAGTGGVFTYVSGDGANLTNLSVSAGSSIVNGSSNATVDASGAFRVSTGGTANLLVVQDTGVTAIVTGSMSVTGGLEAINFNSTSNLGPVANVTITGGTSGGFLKTNGSGTLSFDTATLVPAQGADTQIIFNDGGSTYAGNTGFTFNKASGDVAVPGNINVPAGKNIVAGGNVNATLLGGALSTAAQPNITSVGTLTSLILGGAFNTNSNIITNAGNIEISSGSGTFKGNGGGLTNLPGANVSGAVPLATSATSANAVAGANVSGEVDFAQVANAVAGANVSGTVALATTATTASTANAVAGGNVSGAVALASSATSANAVAGANVSGAVALASSATSANAVAGGNVSGAVSFATTANAVAGGNVSGAVSFAGTANAVAGANVSGQVANSLVSGTVYTAAQPNVTSVGTLLLHSNTDTVSAAGTTQGDATQLTTEINRVTTVGASSGVKLPNAVGGLIIFITNTSATTLAVYPNTSDIINSLGTNASYSHPAGGTLQYICTNATNWYTVGATYA